MASKKHVNKKRITLGLISGILLILCGILEGTETVVEDYLNIEVKGHHSIILIGVIHFIYALTDILDGVLTMEH
jgi:hypothetical protein